MQKKATNMNFACLLTVRTGSSRLPQKPLLKVQGKRLLEHVIERMKLSKEVDQIILCTSDNKADDILEDIAEKYQIPIFRGSLNDKIARWLGASKKFKFDYFVTVDAGDDIFCDPGLIDEAVRQMRDKPCDYLKIPDGLVCGGSAPVISTCALKKVFATKNTNSTEYYPIYFTGSSLFRVRDMIVADPIYYNDRIRLTLDYREDYDFFVSIFKELQIENNTIPLKNILEFLIKRPTLCKINFFRQQDYLNDQKTMKKMILNRDIGLRSINKDKKQQLITLGKEDGERLYLRSLNFKMPDNQRVKITKTTEPGIDMDDLIARHFARYGLLALFSRPGFRVMDFPCGSGYASEFLQRFNIIYEGKDIDPYTIQYAKNVYGGNSASFSVGDLCSPKLQKNKYDIVGCIEGLEHIEYKYQPNLISTFYDSLKGGGVLVISTPENISGISGPSKINPYHKWELSKKDFLELLYLRFGKGNVELVTHTSVLSPGNQRMTSLFGICKKN